MMILFFAQAQDSKSQDLSRDQPVTALMIQREGPLVVPTGLVVKGMLAVLSTYTSLLIFGGKWIWGKRKDEVAAIKTELVATNKKIADNLEKATELYETHRTETNEMISGLTDKVDRHHESVMGFLVQIHERRNGSRL